MFFSEENISGHSDDQMKDESRDENTTIDTRKRDDISVLDAVYMKLWMTHRALRDHHMR
jgi:hypothetical protein